jgi:hypothetical protein
MKKTIKYFLLLMVVVSFTACLKSNEFFEDFSSTQPTADIPKAPANTVTRSTAPTNSWFTLDSSAAGVDYPTAVHISAKNHVGDVTVRMKIDKTAGQAFITRVPYTVLTGKDTVYYEVIPDSLYTVPSYDVVVKNAGVFNTGDFNVHIKTGALAPDGQDVFIHTKANKHKFYILPVSIDTVTSHPFTVESNFKTILWKINVKKP